MKKNILRSLAILAVAGLLGATASAQDTKQDTKAPRRGAQVEERLKQLSEELNLTPEQKAKIKPVLEKEREKVQALRSDTSLTREQRQEKMRAMRADLDKQIKPILTADQYQKWEKSRAEMRNRARQGAGKADDAAKKEKAKPEADKQ